MATAILASGIAAALATSAVAALSNRAMAEGFCGSPQAELPGRPEPCGHEAAGSLHFIWPARGRVIVGCGMEDEGVTLALSIGTAVRATEAGIVVFAGSTPSLKAYGKLILIRHADGFASAYAYTSELDVKAHDLVQRGQIIARSGDSGAAIMPELRFELRKAGMAAKAEALLPCR